MRIRSGQKGTVVDGFTEVTVQVPVERLGDFHVMYGNWLRGDRPPGETQAEMAPLSLVDANATQRLAEWGVQDVEDAQAVWSKMTERARAICHVLMKEPERKFSGAELARLSGVQGGFGFLGGFLSWPAKYCYATGHELLVTYDDERELFWMKPATAQVFSRASEALEN